MADGKKNLKQIAANMENQDMAELKSHIDDLDAVLNSEENTIKAKLPENVFSNTFLPSIAGETTNNDVMLMKYVEYAGGPYKEVDIVGRDGEVLYTCPPLYNRSENTAKTGNIPYSEIAGTYELKKARLPAEADNYMNNVAGGIKQNVKIEENSNEFKWGKIIDKYKKPEINEDDLIVPNLPNTNTDKIDDDIIDYD